MSDTTKPEYEGSATVGVVTKDALTVCRALDRPLTALSSLVEAVAAHAHQSEELRAQLERVGQQAAAVHALVQVALAAGSPSPVPRAAVRGSAPPALLNSLTEREYEVLVLVAEGLASKEIAHRLGITLATVRSHVQNILTKLGVCNRRQAAALLAGRLSAQTRARLRAARRPQPTARTSSSVVRLTRREVQVLRCLAAGFGRSEIAERLYVSPHTARTHIRRVLAKLGVHSALGAMAVAREVGLSPVT